jgi:hypothetical protein
MPAVMNIISNGYKNLKNNPNIVKPLRGVIFCVIVATKNIKLWKIANIAKKLSQN